MSAAPRLAVTALFFLLSSPQAAHGNESGRCPRGSHWVRQYHRRAYQRADGVFFAASTVSAHCSKNPAGYDAWNKKFRQGRPHGWPLKEETSSWTEEEKERVLEALSFLPSELRTAAIKGLYRMRQSINFPNAASGDSTGILVLYDNVFDLKHNLSQILAHELAHQVYRDMDPAESSDYRDAMLWWDQSRDPNRHKWICLRNGFVEPDGSDSPAEDFSNNIEYFLFNPAKLKVILPLAYDWIKARFGASFGIGKGSPK